MSAAATVAIIADTHMPRGRRALPAACVRRLREADLVLHAGDLCALEVLADLQAMCNHVVAVHGNVDSPAVRARLPETAQVDIAGATLGLIHDAGPSRGRLARMRARFPGADAVVFGHSHIPLHESQAAFQIFNPGSPTERRRAPAHTMGIATVHAGSVTLRHVQLS